MAVHKDSITIAVPPMGAKTPTHLDRLPNEVPLVCPEDSSGARERKGSITKAGNSHCRHVLA